MDTTKDIKRIVLKILVVSLSASGLLGIFIFLFGEFGETEAKILLTTLSIGGCCLTGLCCSTIYHSEKYKILSVIGIGTAVLCFVFAVFSIWGELKILEYTWKLLVSLIVLTITFAHVSLLLNIKIVNRLVKITLTTTIIFIGIVAFMLLTLIFGEFNQGEFFFRLLGVFGILDIVGTIVTPILNKTQKQDETK